MRELRIHPVIIKIAVVALAIKEIWLLLGIPKFEDAIVSFLTVGAVPGTNRTLSPDEIYRLLAVVFLLAMLLIFHRDLWRLTKRLDHRADRPDVTLATPMPMPIDAPPAGLQPVAEKKTIMVGLAGRLRASLAIARTKADDLWRLARPFVVRVSIWVRAHGKRGYVLALAWLRKGCRLSVRALTQVTLALLDAAKKAWRWAEPHIRQFDAWLDHTLHHYGPTSAALSFGSEMIVTVQKWLAAARHFKEDRSQN